MTDQPTAPDSPEAGSGRTDAVAAPDGTEILAGPSYFYRARQIIVNVHDHDQVAAQLTALGGRPQEVDDVLQPYVVLYLMPPNIDIPTLVTRLRSVPDGPEPRVGPNHVLFGESLAPVSPLMSGVIVGAPNYQGGPDGWPQPAPEIPAVPVGNGGIPVAVIDTGTWDQAEALPLLTGRFGPSLGGFDAVYDDTGLIAAQGGHGTMVAGVIAQHSSNALLMSVLFLTPAGVGDDLKVSTVLLQSVAAGAQVVNMSFTCRTQDDKAPVALESVLEDLPPSVALIAAAGNAGSVEPYWPAAFKRCVAVAAVDTTTGADPPLATAFTNRGPWVDACAAGVDVHSTYVNGNWCVAPDMTFSGHARWSGTSFAAPRVAAAVVEQMMLSGSTAREAVAALLHAPGRTVISGCGVLVR